MHASNCAFKEWHMCAQEKRRMRWKGRRESRVGVVLLHAGETPRNQSWIKFKGPDDNHIIQDGR